VKVRRLHTESFDLSCGPDHVVTHVQEFPKSGTVQVTVKRKDRADDRRRRRLSAAEVQAS
jgi:hypothetical protein